MTPDRWYGRDLGGYRVGEELGTALGGELYAAQQLARGRAVILKIVDPTVTAATGFRGRFERDVALLGSIFHPHVVTLYGAGTVDGASFLAMRPDDDPSLEELIAESGALDTPRATAIVAQVATALDAVHQRGLVHRGLSPASILVRAAGDGEHAAITDFAVADDTSGYGGLFAPPEGTAPPPIDYAAPEQVRGDPATAASDVYALGAILFHALTGFAPYSDLPRGATLEAHLNEPVPRATALIFDLAPSFDDLFARALAKDPADRFAAAGELVAAIPVAERAAPRRAGATALSRRPAAADAAPTGPPEAGAATAHDAAMPPAAASPAPTPRPEFHFLREEGYDARAGSASYGPPETGAGAPGGLGPDATEAFDAALADAVDLDDADLDADLDEERRRPPAPAPAPEDPEPEPSAAPDPELDALLAAAAAPAGETPPPRARRGARVSRKRPPPEIQTLEGIVSPPRRRRRRRPGIALIAAGMLLLAAGVSVLIAGGLFDGGDGAQPAATTTTGGDDRTEADALADLRGTATSPPPAAEPASPPPPPPSEDTPPPPPVSATDDASASVSGWPAGKRGYTAVVFTSPTDRATASERARQASELGLTSGVLRSDDFANLAPGIWVTFAGISDTQAGAERSEREIREAGLASEPYVRLIDPR